LAASMEDDGITSKKSLLGRRSVDTTGALATRLKILKKCYFRNHICN